MAKQAYQPDTTESTQTNLNRSMDADFDQLAVELLGYDGTDLQRVKVNTAGELTLSNATLEGVGVFDSFEQVQDTGVTTGDRTTSFAQQVSSAVIQNLGDNDCFINFDGAATTSTYKLAINESLTVPLKFTDLHAITSAGTTTVQAIGFY